MAGPQEVVSYDPNESNKGGAILPTAGGVVVDLDQYCAAFENPMMKKVTVTEDAIEKSIGEPPKTYTFSRMSMMPDPSDGRIIPWPGISPDALQKIVRENVAPQLIIGMRVDDVMRYSTKAKQPWRPGWIFETVSASKVTEQDKKDMLAAEMFLENCNDETNAQQARVRDEHQLTDLQRFLSAMVRDTYTYDGIAIWTDADEQGKTRAFKAMPAGYIRLCTPRGYLDDHEAFAVMIDEGGKIVQTFKRNELIWYVRNTRTDPVAGGYGYSEVEVAVRLIQGFQNAIDLNCDTFSRNAIPNGILLLKGGGWVQRQVDVLSRVWGNLKKGITKAWALPVLATPKDGDVEILDLNDLKGQDVRYDNHMNMMAGAFCTVFRFPVRRLGYRISGKGKDTEMPDDSSTNAVDDDDPGRKPLLVHIENIVNQYLIAPKWPNLRWVITGKDPKEDARQYEALQNARTWKESRAEAGLPDLTTMVEGDDLKELAKLMEMCPVDPNKAGVFQTLVGAFFKAKQDDQGDPDTPGGRMRSKKDPAASEAHGHTSGVRRDSRAETH